MFINKDTRIQMKKKRESDKRKNNLLRREIDYKKIIKNLSKKKQRSF